MFIHIRESVPSRAPWYPPFSTWWQPGQQRLSPEDVSDPNLLCKEETSLCFHSHNQTTFVQNIWIELVVVRSWKCLQKCLDSWTHGSFRRRWSTLWQPRSSLGITPIDVGFCNGARSCCQKFDTGQPCYLHRIHYTFCLEAARWQRKVGSHVVWCWDWQ
jgi:hypothetical protein